MGKLWKVVAIVSALRMSAGKKHMAPSPRDDSFDESLSPSQMARLLESEANNDTISVYRRLYGRRDRTRRMPWVISTFVFALATATLLLRGIVFPYDGATCLFDTDTGRLGRLMKSAHWEIKVKG